MPGAVFISAASRSTNKLKRIKTMDEYHANSREDQIEALNQRIKDCQLDKKFIFDISTSDQKRFAIFNAMNSDPYFREEMYTFRDYMSALSFITGVFWVKCMFVNKVIDKSEF